MTQPLSQLAVAYWANPKKIRAQYDCPFLVWETSSRQHNEEIWMGTQTGGAMSAPRAGEPLVFPVLKAQKTTNAFGMGITVGRTDANDIVVEDQSVSRFHAYFQHDERANTWKLSDAESKNGTFIADKRLAANVATLVEDSSRVRFGDIGLVFMTSPSFFKYLEAMSKGRSDSPGRAR